MAFDTHLDLKLSLVTAICLIVAWGPVIAAIAAGIATGLASAKADSEKRKVKSRG